MDFSLCANALRSKWRNPPSLQDDKVRFLCPSLRASKASVAIHEFKRKFTFGLPRICTLALCKFSQWQNPCQTDWSLLSFTISCHTSLRSVWQEIVKYDEIYQYDKDNKIRQNKSVWQILGFCLNFCKLLCKSALILHTMTKNSQKFTNFSSHLSLKFKRAFQPFANKTHKSLATFTKLLWNFFRKVLTN